MPHLDVNLLPLDTPLIMLNVSGDRLSSDRSSLFVELRRLNDGLVTIRDANRKVRSLDVTYSVKYYGKCCFNTKHIDSFHVELSRSGWPPVYSFRRQRGDHEYLVTTTKGNEKVCICNASLSSRSWLLLQPYELEACITTEFLVSDLQRLVARSSHSDRQQLVMRLIDFGYYRGGVGWMLKLLYGSIAPSDDQIKTDPANVERRKLIVQLASPGGLRQVEDALQLLYGTTGLLDARGNAELNAAAHLEELSGEESQSDSEAQYVKVERCEGQNRADCQESSMKHLNVDALPLEVSLVMMTAAGDHLAGGRTCGMFVTLHQVDQDRVVIEDAENQTLSLGRGSDAYKPCCFGSDGLRFELKVSAAGYLVFEDAVTKNALDIETQGPGKVLVCRSKFKGETQEWFLLKPYEPDVSAAFATSEWGLQRFATANSDASRRELIMALLECDKTTEEIGELLELLYGSTTLCDGEIKSYYSNVERREKILRLVESRSAKEIKSCVELMYPTKVGEEE